MGRDAQGAVGVRVSWVASKASALSRSRGDKGQGTVSGDARSAIWVRVSWVARKTASGDGGCRSDQGQGASSRDARGTVGV
jgi:hypothetical protein